LSCCYNILAIDSQHVIADPKLREQLARLHERVLEGASEEVFRERYAAIGHDVAQRRGQLGLSQRELAQLCGTKQSAIARLERGGRAPRIDTLLRISLALDCELEVVLRPKTRGTTDAA
jgi:ribosome-binding protein aMBF1 (putative translation factor)